MINYYQPFDNLNINWLIFTDNNLINIDNNSLIKSNPISNEILNYYTKSLTKVNSIITGLNAHNLILKEKSINKNINNELCQNIMNQKINLKYNESPVFLAHYVYKCISSAVNKKFIHSDGNFDSIFKKFYK